jgi:hypothetical protein
MFLPFVPFFALFLPLQNPLVSRLQRQKGTNGIYIYKKREKNNLINLYLKKLKVKKRIKNLTKKSAFCTFFFKIPFVSRLAAIEKRANKGKKGKKQRSSPHGKI